MKTFWIFLILFLTIESTISQVVFCPPGAKWNYNWAYSFSPWPQAAYNDQIVYVGDTIIGIDTVKKLQHSYFSVECMSFHCRPTYLKQIGDTIFMKNNCTNSWQILYNFAATPGSVWQNTFSNFPGAGAIHQFTVLSIGTITINGISLKKMDVTYKYTGSTTSSFPVTIIERLGSNYLFHFRKLTSTDCHYISRNLCYSDSSFGVHQYWEYPCDFANPVGFDEIIEAQYPTKVYPNPSSDFIQLHNLPGSSTYTFNLMDFSGKLIISSVLGPEQQIDTQGLKNGIYFLELSSETLNHPFRTKIIKQ